MQVFACLNRVGVNSNGDTNMKTKSPLIVFVIAAILLTSCRFNRPDERSGNPTSGPNTPAVTAPPVAFTSEAQTQTQVLQFAPGRNDYILEVDGTPREFILHIPSGYDPNIPTPVVVMIHGTNQSGAVMYENTGWADTAEAENIIVAFPTGWKYPLVGENGLHEKWNTPGTATEVEPGTELKDDVKFIRTMIEDLKVTFTVDNKRIFASGFSNGGGFVITRLIPEMNDVFAAFSNVGSGLIGKGEVEDVSVKINASLYSILGTNDNKLAEGQGIPVPFAFTEQEIVNDPIFSAMFDKTIALLNLQKSYMVESDTDFTRFTFAKSNAGADNEYVFMMIRGMGHVYPSEDKSRAGVNAADIFWDFFLKHPKP